MAQSVRELRLTEAAAADLRDIFEYSFDMFGSARAEIYRADLVTCFSRLADSPMMGRTADHVATGVRRFEHARHGVFYELAQEGIVIPAIVHVSSIRSLL